MTASVAEVLPPLPQDTLSDVDIPTLITVLNAQHAQKLDHVVPTSSLFLNEGGHLAIAGLEEVDVPPVINEAGVSGGFRYDPSGLYRLSNTADANLSALFDIPLRYVRRLREQDPALLAENVNKWAAKASGKRMVRTIYGSIPSDESLTGYVRAILSDRYLIMDNLDTVMSFLQGLDEAGYSAENIRAINLTPNRMYIDVEVPEIAVPGRSLVENYVSPFTGQTGAELPLVHSGIRMLNSEIGKGKFDLVPYAIFEVCSNGAQINADALSKVHLGGRLEEGTINWSASTRKVADEFVRNQVRDAVNHFMTEDYLNSVVDRLEEAAGVEVTRPETVVETVGKEMAYTAEEQENILSKFMVSRKFDSGGVFQAVTAAAQDIKDADRQFEVLGSAPEAMKVAARVAAVA